MAKEKEREMTLEEVHDYLFDMLVDIDELFRVHSVPYMLTFGTLLGAVRHQDFIPWDDDVDIHIPGEEFNRAMALLEKFLGTKYKLHYKKNELLTWDIDARLRDTKTEIVFEERKQSSSNCNHPEKAKGLFIDFFQMPYINKINRINFTLLQMLKRTMYPHKNTFFNLVSFAAGSIAYILLSPIFYTLELIPFKKVLIVRDKFTGGCYNISDIYPLIELPIKGRNFLAPAHYHKILTDMYGLYMELPPVTKRKKHFKYCLKKG